MFTWGFAAKGQPAQEFGGTYSVEENVLALESQDGGSLVVEITPDNEKFNFRLRGAPEDDKGLNFTKSYTRIIRKSSSTEPGKAILMVLFVFVGKSRSSSDICNLCEISADAESASKRANDSSYGLGGSVFTQDKARGRSVAEQIESGYTQTDHRQEKLQHLTLS